ncbi:MAG: serine protease [Phycisphaeraceae bacterium]|nr:serine protease [Phycisphaeraceae bacterium]
MSTPLWSLGRAVAAACLASLVSASAVPDTPREIAKRVSPSVVLLVMEDANGQPLAMGSGFVVREGIVATNMHVIEGAARGYAKLTDDKTKNDIRGIVASDHARDLVLLSVDGLKADALIIGDSEGVAAGDTIYAVGNPRGLEGTFSAGIVSSVRKVGDDSLLQITAPVSPGSSGGPVLNSKGEVIGLAVATFKGGQNLNFAIPSAYLSALIPAIKAPVDLPTAAKARRAKKEKSILDEMGGRSTEGVEGGTLTWDSHSGTGAFSLSFRNKLRDPVKSIVCLVVFYDDKGSPLDVAVVTFNDVVPAGLARRATGSVHESTEKLNTPVRNVPPRTPKNRVEFRILYFDIVNPDEPVDERSAAQPSPRLPERKDDADRARTATARDTNPSSLENADAELKRLETQLAEAAAKIAPAGDGPDLIESHIISEFEGWDGDTLFALDNGQVWQQVSYSYTYHYAYRPKVMIVKTQGAYKMFVEGVANSIFVKRLEEDDLNIFDRGGVASAYIGVSDDLTIYLWSGKPVAYLDGKSVYGFTGAHLGWFVDGALHDHRGGIVGATARRLAIPTKPKPSKGTKQVKPIKGIQRLAPLEPLYRITWSDTPTAVFLLQGAK